MLDVRAKCVPPSVVWGVGIINIYNNTCIKRIKARRNQLEIGDRNQGAGESRGEYLPLSKEGLGSTE